MLTLILNDVYYTQFKNFYHNQGTKMNENIKIKLQELVNTVDPTQLSRKVKADKELWAEVSIQPGLSISEQIYTTLNGDVATCPNGNRPKFRSYAEGYRFCGRQEDCKCNKDSVRAAVIEDKATYSTERKHDIQEKMYATNMEKYGVDNISHIKTIRNNELKSAVLSETK